MENLAFDFSQATPLETMLSTFVPARARNTDPVTSHLAAQSWDKHKLTATQCFVLSFFQRFGAGSDFELEQWIAKTYPVEKFAPSSLRKRRKDLVDKGILRDSGRRDDRKKMIVWEMSPRQDDSMGVGTREAVVSETCSTMKKKGL